MGLINLQNLTKVNPSDNGGRLLIVFTLGKTESIESLTMYVVKKSCCLVSSTSFPYFFACRHDTYKSVLHSHFSFNFYEILTAEC